MRLLILITDAIYLNPCSVPGMVLSPLPASDFTFRATHFTDEELESESLNISSKVTHLASGRTQPGSQVFLMPKGLSPTHCAYYPPPPEGNKYCDGGEGWYNRRFGVPF